MARPFRSTFIIAIVGLAAGLAAFGGWRFARASAPVNGPVILISIDTLRADHLPAYGYTRLRTPAIDQLAADGLVFERAYAHVPQTRPAHAALLTGRLPFETGVRGARGVLKKADRLIAPMLRDRGYATAGVVSTEALGRDSGLAEGFDFYDAEMPPPDGPALPGSARRAGAETVLVAERWLEMQRSSRVFLFLQIDEPRRPWNPPERFAGYAPYDAAIAQADDVIGTFIAWLKAHQMYDRSTIVLTSDHGEGLGDHGETDHGLFVYDEALRVPLIVKQPGAEGGGRRSATPVQQIDIVPTILDLVKAPIPGSLRGRSLTPVLAGDGTLPPRTFYAESMLARDEFGWSPLVSIADARFQYIAAPREELYDLTNDPRERDNVAEANPKVVASMRDALKAIAGAVALQPTRENEIVDPKDRWQIVERYRGLLRAESEGNWVEAGMGLRQLAAEAPSVPAIWRRLAELSMRAERFADASSAYAHAIELEPDDPSDYLGAAEALLKLHRLDEAKDQAERALEAASDKKTTAWARIDAHLLMADIALARGDADAARDEGRRAQEVDVRVPGPSYVEARILYDDGDYAGAAEAFDRILAAIRRGERRAVRDLHYYAAETFAKVDRPAEAESELMDALRGYPGDVRSRAALASFYHDVGRDDDASRALADMLKFTPTAETYAQAARLSIAFGDRRQADAFRAEAKRTFKSAAR